MRAAGRGVAHAESARQFAVTAARLAADTRCKDVVVLDVRGLSPVTDYFVLGTGSSARQMRSVAMEMEAAGEPMGFRALSRSGEESATWLLTDFVDVIVHLFAPEARGFYDLDSLWGDATKVDWARPPGSEPRPGE